MIIGIEKIEKCDPRIKNLVDWIYDIYHTVVITSGYRSPDANAALPNSSKTSAHCLGLAVDLTVPSACILVVAGVIKAQCPDITGIGLDVYKNYVHLDYKPVPFRMWAYGKDGKEC
jgi:uncharacterized protein YcbK (DUF882 family)